MQIINVSEDTIIHTISVYCKRNLRIYFYLEDREVGFDIAFYLFQLTNHWHVTYAVLKELQNKEDKKGMLIY